MMILELYGEDSAYGATRKAANATHTEVRLGAAKTKEIKAGVAVGASDDLLYAVRVSRGASDLDAVDAFYTNVMEARSVCGRCVSSKSRARLGDQ